MNRDEYTEDQLAVLREAARIVASAGGRTAAANMTPEQRSERARKAAAARWANRP